MRAQSRFRPPGGTSWADQSCVLARASIREQDAPRMIQCLACETRLESLFGKSAFDDRPKETRRGVLGLQAGEEARAEDEGVGDAPRAGGDHCDDGRLGDPSGDGAILAARTV